MALLKYLYNSYRCKSLIVASGGINNYFPPQANALNTCYIIIEILVSLASTLHFFRNAYLVFFDLTVLFEGTQFILIISECILGYVNRLHL